MDPNVEKSLIFRFGEFELDERRLELRAVGAPVPLHATPLRLLVYLVRNASRVISKEELLTAVWPDVAVSDMALSTALKQIRHALKDDGSQQRWIRTQRGLGYCFVGEVAAGIAVTEAAVTRSMCGNAPAPSLSFVGRDAELAHLTEMLAETRPTGIHVAIEGPPGIGKTELALQLALRSIAADRFPGGVFWIDAESPDLVSVWGNTLAEQCRVLRDSPGERCKELIRRLEERREPTLIVLDNVESWSSNDRPHPLPAGPHIRTVVTTRIRNLGGARFEHLSLGFLPSGPDRTLLVRLAARDPGPGTDDLVAHLAGHTLALELAGAFLATYPGETARSYLAVLLEKSGHIEFEVRDLVRYERTVDQGFRTLWDRLDPTIRNAWRLAACFEPEAASRDLAAAAGLTPESLRALEKLHLLHFRPDGRWNMHRLIHGFGRRVGSDEERLVARRAFLDGCLQRTRGLNRHSAFHVYVPDRAHIDAAMRIGAELLGETSERLNRLRSAVATALDPLGDIEGSRALLHRVVASYRRRLEAGVEDPARRAVLWDRLGGVLWKLAVREDGTGSAEAAVHAFHASLLARTRSSAPRAWAASQNGLGLALRELGQRRRDPDVLQESVDAFRSALLEWKRELVPAVWARTQTNLANALSTLGRIQGDPARLEEALAASSCALGVYTRDGAPLEWAWTERDRARTLADLGRLESDTTKLHQAAEILRAVLEEMTADRLPLDRVNVQRELTLILLAIGRSEKNLGALEEALGTVRSALEHLHSELHLYASDDTDSLHGNVLESLGAIEGTTSRLDDALVAYRAALAASTRAARPYAWARCQHDIGRVLRKLGRARSDRTALDEALRALQAAREIWSSTDLALDRELKAADREIGDVRAALQTLDG
jgi:DNA-binding winged helix-turn-helix (wHTH) protein/tetratricopeptide (TPR) repeat protein